MDLFTRRAGRGGIAVPAIVVLLGLAAIASLALIQQSTTASREAQLRLAALKTDLNRLQSEPFDASGSADGDATVVLRRMRAGGRRVRNTVAELSRDSPPRALVDASVPLLQNLATLERVYALIRLGRDDAADRVSAVGDRQSAAASRLLAQASRDYKRRAARSRREAAYGSRAVILLLLAAFWFLYRRSTKARLAVERSEHRFRTLVANVPGAVYRRGIDDDWSMQFVSETIEEISGYPASHFVTGEGSWASLVESAQREWVTREVAAAGDGKVFTAEYPITHADGSRRWVQREGPESTWR